MVHTFNFKDKYFLYDVESGSLHLCDKLSFFVVKNLNGEKILLDKYTEKEIEESKAEIDELIKEGVLFSKAPDFIRGVDIERWSDGQQAASGENSRISNTRRSRFDRLSPYQHRYVFTPDIKALCLHISHDCNLRCEYCFAGGGNYNTLKDLMDLDTAKASIDFLIRNSGSRKNLEIDFFGGEPLMNFETVKQTVYYAKEKAKRLNKTFKFTLTTNALLLTDEITDFLNLEMDNVVLSIDGRPKIHDAVRKTLNNKGSFNATLKKAREFKEKRANKNYYIRGTYTALNLDFSKDILYLNDCGFDQISVEPVVLEENNPLAIKPCHIENIKTEYEKFADSYIERRKTEKWFNFFHFMIDLETGPCLKKRLTGCGAGCEYLAVSPGGEIYPCHRFVGLSEYKLGNVFKEKLNSDIRNIFINSDLLTKPECLKCFAKYHCGGGCAANNIFLQGGIDKPYKLSCEIMKKRLECSLYIYAAERK